MMPANRIPARSDVWRPFKNAVPAPAILFIAEFSIRFVNIALDQSLWSSCIHKDERYHDAAEDRRNA